MRERIRYRINKLFGNTKTKIFSDKVTEEKVHDLIMAMDTPIELNAVVDALYEKEVLE